MLGGLSKTDSNVYCFLLKGKGPAAPEMRNSNTSLSGRKDQAMLPLQPSARSCCEGEGAQHAAVLAEVAPTFLERSLVLLLEPCAFKPCLSNKWHI